MTEVPGNQIRKMLGELLLKTFYGHTVGEVLALEVAITSTVETLIATALAESDEAREELTELVLSRLSRERQLQIFRELLSRRGSTDAAGDERDIRAVYQLRDRFAHSGLAANEFSEDGWLLAGRRGAARSGSPVSPNEVERVLANGRRWLSAVADQANGRPIN